MRTLARSGHTNTRITAVQKGRVGTHQWDISVPEILSLNLAIVRTNSIRDMLITNTRQCTVYFCLVNHDRGHFVICKGDFFSDVS